MNNYGQIQIKPGSEAAKLITQLGTKNKTESLAAQEAFAAFIGPVIQMVVEQAPVISNLYTTESFLEGTAPSLPLDVYFDVKDRDYIQVWTQTLAGGTATSEIKGLSEMFVTTYDLDSAWSMPKKYAREARLNVVAATIQRMAEEFLVKQEINSAAIICKALADARYSPLGDSNANTPQIIRSGTANVFTLDDFNKLITLLGNIRPSWWGGTPVSSNAVTHIVGSLALMEQIRSIAYQPVNTRAGSIGGTETSNTSIPASDAIRAAVWQTAGLPNFFGVELVQAYELGVNRRYNTLLSRYLGATGIPDHTGSGTTAFDPTTEEAAWVFNLTNAKSLVRLVQEDAGGGRVVTLPDDQFLARADKVGWYSKLNEGRVILDHRGAAAIVF